MPSGGRFSKILMSDSEFPEMTPSVNLYKAGYQSYINGDFGAARAAWEKALMADPNNREAEMGLRRLR
jgi:hypothetical protein